MTLWNADNHAISYQLGVYADPEASVTEASLLNNFCLDCHDDNGSTALDPTGDNTPLSPFTDSNLPPDIATTWSSSSHGTLQQTANGSGEITTCFGDGSFGCHASGHGSEKLELRTPDPHLSATSPDFSEQKEGFCLNCHRSSGESSFDINSGLLAGNDNVVTSPGGTSINQMHDILPADGDGPAGGDVTCRDCHEPHMASDTWPNVDPDNQDVQFTTSYDKGSSYNGLTYDSSGASLTNLDPTAPQGGTSYSEPDYINFCLTCHDGTTPAGVTMPGTMIDIEYFYLDPLAGGNRDYHGAGDAGTAGNGFFKAPWVNQTTPTPTVEPSAPYAALNCTLCHDAHSSTNIYNLRTSITIGDHAPQEVGGWTGDTIGTAPGDGGDPTQYTLPLTSKTGTQSDHDWGAWCSFCHQMEKHGVDEDKACRSGHMHGGGAF